MLARVGSQGRKGRGATLVELLTLVIVLVILAAFAIPSMSPVVMRHRLRGATWQVAGDLRLARQRAVTERKRFRVCLTSCAVSLPDGSSYSIERDEGSWVSDTGAPVRLPQDISVTASAQACFLVTGMLDPSCAVGSTFTVTNVMGTYKVKVAATGRVMVCEGAC